MTGRNGPVVVAQSIADVRAIARVLGHADLQVFQSGGRWFTDCACGWRGSGLVSQVEALRKAQHHLAEAVREVARYAHDHGLPEGDALGALAVDEEEFDLHVADRIEARRMRGW